MEMFKVKIVEYPNTTENIKEFVIEAVNYADACDEACCLCDELMDKLNNYNLDYYVTNL